MPQTTLFPPLEPYRHGMLPVDEIHTIYWEECGNPQGQPVLFLHGGPGAGCSPAHRRFFDPAHYRIVLFDQRGAGRSTPLGEIRNNTTQLLIDDIERLRAMLGIEKWLVFGGSWGSTLALAYGEAHPQQCLGFVLRGIFLCTQDEIDWFIDGASEFHPDVHAEFAAMIPPQERGNLLQAYARRILQGEPQDFLPYARAWTRYEDLRVYMLPRAEEDSDDELCIGVGRLEAHYMVERGFFADNQLLNEVKQVRHLPCFIVHGRYDVICTPKAAWRLHQAWPGSRLEFVPDAGHAAMESGICKQLVQATENFKLHGHFG
ncbi:prolyl aminopeptidase [Massilia sp. W12]|uniref:prolyl aminopeptidase n=1 Tax=Massilia sp. W12 TaxID=3126507 RepID=UPI0030CB14E0